MKKDATGNSGTTVCSTLLPVGTRIRFVKSLYGSATGDSPACVYAEKGDGGVVTGHGTPEGHWVKWDKWPHAFGSEYGTEFVEAEQQYFIVDIRHDWRKQKYITFWRPTAAPLHGIVLLPCPFCGESAVKLKHNDLYRIRHLETCWFSGKDFSQRASLIEPDEVEEWVRMQSQRLSRSFRSVERWESASPNLSATIPSEPQVGLGCIPLLCGVGVSNGQDVSSNWGGICACQCCCLRVSRKRRVGNASCKTAF